MPTQPEDILPILEVVGGYDMSSELWWRCDGEFAPVTFLINCNDLFAWATADAEELTIADLPMLRQAIEDCQSVSAVHVVYADTLFVCRKRGMRPQSPWYRNVSENMRDLFNACGPYRDPKDEG